MMKNLEYTFLLTIDQKHMDVFGHVNNAAYLSLFEMARWDLIAKNGYDATKIISTGLGPVVLEINIKFLKELYLNDQVSIKTQMKSYNSKIGQIHQEMFRDGQLCCQADIVLGLIDLSTRKLVLPSQDWLKAIGMA